MRWSRFTPVARPSLEKIVHKARWAQGTGAPRDLTGRKEGVKAIFLCSMAGSGSKCGEFGGCGVAARHHIYRLVRTAGSFGSGSPKKENLGRKS